MSNAISVTHMQSELNVQDNQTNFPTTNLQDKGHDT